MIQNGNNKIVALLPMKGHSERIPNKNLKLFHGAPLYHRIVESILKSAYLEKIIVNTDSEEIKCNILNNFHDKIIIVNRPKSICGDYISMNNIIDYDISLINDYSHFFQTHSTNPLLSTTTIDEAIDRYFKLIAEGTYDSLFSVNRFKSRFYWDNGKPINHNPKILIRTQDLPVIFEENSNFYVFSRKSFVDNEKNRIGKKPYLFEMRKEEAIDIDDSVDFNIAERLF